MVWWIVFRKELWSVLTHFQTYRRWSMALALPFLLFWVLFTITGRFIDQQLVASSQQKYKIAFIHHDNAKELQEKLKNNLTFTLVENISEDSLTAMVKRDSLQAAMVLPKDFDTLLQQNKQVDVRLIHAGANLGGAASQLREALNFYEQDLVRNKLELLNLPLNLANPISISAESTQGITEQLDFAIGLLQAIVSNLLALFVILFGLWASKHTAIQLYTHEHYEKTLERLLSATPNHFGIWLGKALALGLVAVIAAWLALAGFYISFKMPYSDMGKTIVEILGTTLSLGKVLKIGFLAIPTCLFLSLCWTLFATASRTPYQASRMGFFFYMLVGILCGLFVALKISDAAILLYLPIANTVVLVQSVINESASIMHYVIFVGLYSVALVALSILSSKWFVRGASLRK